MFDKIPVEGNPGLYRDKFSGAIVNCSDMDFSRYLQLKEQKIVEANEMKKIKIKSMKLMISKKKLPN